MNDIPEEEINFFLSTVDKHPEYLNIQAIKDKYKSYNLNVIENPFSKNIIEAIKLAVINESPLSVIRIGDGEANILTFNYYTETPILNSYAIQSIVSMQQDSFILTEQSMKCLSNEMLDSIKKADIIGVIGLWRARKPTTKIIKDEFLSDYRGISGHWRAIEQLLEFGKSGILEGKIIASAHLYFSILKYLPELLSVTSNLLVISNNTSIADKINNNHPNINIKQIVVGKNSTQEINKTIDDTTPFFLYELKTSLPLNLKGYLCLIGAGPWSEIYCSWIKERGGVAVDIGSGFDLLDNKNTRPIHNSIALDEIKNYK